MDTITILWADDEINGLKPQIKFLENKGFKVITVSNGYDALEEIKDNKGVIDIVLLDESMPGITGLETLPKIKEVAPNVPVVMITKNEEEGVMEQWFRYHLKELLIHMQYYHHLDHIRLGYVEILDQLHQNQQVVQVK